MLRITFLGTSGSAPTVERSMPAIALKYEKELLLFDCGEATQRQMMKYKTGYGSVNAIFISHPHLDHYLGVFGLMETLNLMARPRHKIHVHAFEGLGKNLEERYDFVEWHGMNEGIVYSGDGFAVEAFRVKHTMDSYGFIFRENDKIKFNEEKAHKLGLKGRMFTEIQKKGFVKTGKKKIKLEDVSWVKKGMKIVYSGDAFPDESLAKAAKDADLLICEGTLDPSMKKEAKERFHCTMEDAAKIAKKAKVKKLVITHISPRYSDVKEYEQSLRKIFKNTVFAYDGMKIEIK